jgi:hypothetical protein
MRADWLMERRLDRWRRPIICADAKPDTAQAEWRWSMRVTKLFPARVAFVLSVAAVGCRDEEWPSPVESEPALATAAAPLSFYQVSSGDHACGITADSRLYC